ncbi:MAG: zinc ribbon domain-containing protein [Pseudomonadota bacterium]
MDWQCTQCGFPFEPQEERGEIQCPRCGVLQDLVRPLKASPALGSLEDQTEHAEPKDPSARNGEGAPSGKVTPVPQVSPVTDPSARARRPDRILDLFGPTLLVCLIFVVWVIWDKKLRPPPAVNTTVQVEVDKALKLSIEALRKGDGAVALRYSNEALRLDPKSELANEVHLLLNPPASGPSNAPPK